MTKATDKMTGHFIFNGIPVRVEPVSNRWIVTLGNSRCPTVRTVDDQPTRQVISELVRQHEAFYSAI
jgi:hypothetical protein